MILSTPCIDEEKGGGVISKPEARTWPPLVEGGAWRLGGTSGDGHSTARTGLEVLSSCVDAHERHTLTVLGDLWAHGLAPNRETVPSVTTNYVVQTMIEELIQVLQ